MKQTSTMPWWIFRFRLGIRTALSPALLPLLLLPLLSIHGSLIFAAAAPGPKILNASPHQSEDGPTLARGDSFRPGETVFFSFQISGYGQSTVKAVRLSYHVEALDPHGVRLEAPVESVFDAVLHDEDKNWMPKLRVPIAIPSVAPPGIYKITVLVTDDVSHLTATSETEFPVEGHEVSPSPELTIRNFSFHGTDEDTHPLAHPAYRAGDSVFARFDIAGYRYASGNTIHVFYDVAVLNQEGKTIHKQEHAAEDRSFSYYPKPYVPAQISLKLQPNMRAGSYTVVVTAHDEIGHQTFEAKQAFTVE